MSGLLDILKKKDRGLYKKEDWEIIFEKMGADADMGKRISQMIDDTVVIAKMEGKREAMETKDSLKKLTLVVFMSLISQVATLLIVWQIFVS